MKQTNKNTTQQCIFLEGKVSFSGIYHLIPFRDWFGQQSGHSIVSNCGGSAWADDQTPTQLLAQIPLSWTRGWINGKDTNREVQRSRQRQGDCTKYTQYNSSSFCSCVQFVENCYFNLTNPELRWHQSLLSACQPPNKYIPSSPWELQSFRW